MATDAQAETLLAVPPGDGIAAVRFGPSSNQLLVASWDSTARLYDADANRPLATFSFKAPCLDCCFVDEEHGYAGSIDRSLRMLDFNRGTDTVIGTHDDAIRCVEYIASHGMLVTGGWDSVLKTWDERAQSATQTIRVPGKVFSMDHHDHRLVVATAGRHVLVYDVRNMSAPEQHRESPLKYQTRCIRCFPNGSGFAVSSVEGRVGIEYFDQHPDVQARKYSFKCHRQGNLAYPVNAIAFHPRFGTFATGGCDGVVAVWDGENRRRVAQFHNYPTSIASLDFNHDGSILAIACSYTFEEGDKPHPEDNVYLRRVSDQEVRPKPKA